MGSRALRLLSWLGSACACALAAAGAARDAEPARLAERALLTAVTTAGDRLVAVGDRGIIILSDDGGAHWAQAAQVPTQALLTGVCFFDAQHGIAVGHDLVALTTADGGRSWQRTHYAPQAQRPLLDVWCGTAGQAIAVGAYSTYLASADGGASWSERTFAPAGAPKSNPDQATAGGTDDSNGGFHLNRIAAGNGARLYIAAEAGRLYRSDDTGASWRQLASPYEGSFFGVLPVGGDAVLAYGLRGNLYRSEDGGTNWRRISTGTLAMLDGGARVNETTVALVGLSGVVLLSRDGGRSFTLRPEADQAGLAAVVAPAPGTLVVVGEGGARRVGIAGVAGGTR